MRHFLLAAIYSACLASFFGVLLREDWKSALRFAGKLFAIMLGSVYALGWLMALASR